MQEQSNNYNKTTQQELDQRAHLTALTGFILDVMVLLWAIQRDVNALYIFCAIAGLVCLHLAYQYWGFATYGRPTNYDTAMQDTDYQQEHEQERVTAQPITKHVAEIVPESRIFSDLAEDRIFFFTQLSKIGRAHV